MNPRIKLNQRSGTILIVALWTLGLLTVFAVEIGFGIRQRIALQKRLVERGKLQDLAHAGVKKAIASLRTHSESAVRTMTAESKSTFFNNTEEFATIELPDGKAEVSYELFTGGTIDSTKKYGMMDEESKLNLNKTDAASLQRLIVHALKLSEEKAGVLAEAILDWRVPGESALVGFYSDAYYENLEFPYPVKDADFEVPDELLLVQGVNDEIFDQLLNYVTLYGEGKININSASRPVLLSLGLDEALVDKILTCRRGPDGLEATSDDHIFSQVYDVAIEVGHDVELAEAEIKAIDNLNAQGKLTTFSDYYAIRSLAQLENSTLPRGVRCIFSLEQNRIVYWKEE